MPDATFTRCRLPALRLAVAAAVTGALLGGGLAALQHEERQLTFRAARDAASWLSAAPAGVEEFDLPVGSGVDVQRIHTWWWPAPRPDAPAVLYLHGAHSNLTGQVFRLQQLREFGFSVLAIDYRGFGKSDGDLPSEATVYEDARAAWDWLVARQPNPAKRFIYGHSLGGAVAVDLAAALSGDGRDGSSNAPDAIAQAETASRDRAADPRQAAAGLIVESTFTRLVDIAKEFSYPWLPLGLLMSQKFDSITKMAKVQMPVLVVHGAGDRYVPYRFGLALYSAAAGPKKLLLIDGGSHYNSMLAGADRYRQALNELFGLGADRVADVSGRAATRHDRRKS